MPIKAANYLLFTVTQGAADAFAQVTIPTGLSTLNNFAYRIRRVSWTAGPFVTAVNAQNIVTSLYRRTKTATPNYIDPDVIFLDIQYEVLTTSGAFIGRTNRDWEPAGEAYIVEDNVYLGVDSNATGVANTWNGRIEYDIVRITDAERSALLARTFLSTAA